MPLPISTAPGETYLGAQALGRLVRRRLAVPVPANVFYKGRISKNLLLMTPRLHEICGLEGFG